MQCVIYTGNWGILENTGPYAYVTKCVIDKKAGLGWLVLWQ